MKKTTLLLTTALSALLLASCEKKPATHPQPPVQADTPAPAEVAEPQGGVRARGSVEKLRAEFEHDEEEYSISVIKKNYNARYNESVLGERHLVLIENYYIKFDEDGFINYYVKKSKFIGEPERVDIEYSNSKVSDNERKLTYKILDSEENKYEEYTRFFLFEDNTWVLKDSKLISTVCNQSSIKKISNNKVNASFIYQDNQVIINLGTDDYLFKAKQGFFYEYEDTFLSKSENEVSQYDAFGTIKKEHDKYIFSKHYDEMSYIYEIKTNYSFKSWKAASFNMLLFYPDVIVIPYALGFGNGFITEVGYADATIYTNRYTEE